MKGNASISQRISEIQAENAELSRLSREDVLSYLTMIVITPAGEVTPASLLCQECVTTTTSDGTTCSRIKMPGKIDALRLMARLCGWETGNKAERDAANALGGVSELIQRIRTRK